MSPSFSHETQFSFYLMLLCWLNNHYPDLCTWRRSWHILAQEDGRARPYNWWCSSDYCFLFLITAILLTSNSVYREYKQTIHATLLHKLVLVIDDFIALGWLVTEDNQKRTQTVTWMLYMYVIVRLAAGLFTND